MLRDPEGNSFLEARYGARQAYQILSSRRADRQQLEQLCSFGEWACVREKSAHRLMNPPNLVMNPIGGSRITGRDLY